VSWDDPFFWPHRVSVRDAIPGGGMGPRFGSPRELAAEVIDSHRLVRTADGREVVSSTRVTVPLDAGVPVGSEVTVWPGRANARKATVLVVSYEDNGDADLGSQLVLSLE